ncbi:MAG: flippase-like domain-containing protein [Planctomycetota bacterium]|nr:flippase-like domain-containing protein [Planctomycetota bacterium]
MSALKFALRLLLGSALLIYLFHEHEVELGGVAERLRALPLWAVLAAVAVDVLSQTLAALRWQRVLRLGGHAQPFRAVWPLHFSGMFFSLCLPTNVGGDVYKMLGMSRRIGSKSASFASLFLHRDLGMAALLSLGFVAALAWPTSIEITLRGTRIATPLWPVFLALGAGFAAVNVILFSRRVYRALDRLLFARLPEAFRAKVAKLHASVQAYRVPLPRFAGIYGLALAYQIAEGGCVWLLARRLGMELPYWVFAALVTFQAVAGLVPVTINNIGVREGVFCAVLLGQAAAAGWSDVAIKDGALALSLGYFGVVMTSGLIGGAVYMASGLSRQPALDPGVSNTQATAVGP